MADQEQPAPKIAVQAQYLRDSSFENLSVRSDEIRTEQKPDIQVSVNLDAKKRQNENYEVILKIDATARAGEGDNQTTLFIAEVEYAGLFRIENLPEAQLHPFLLIECPRILFPFARRIVADMTRDGGYPPLMLDMVDFASLYRNEFERRRAAQANGLEGEPAGNA